MEIVRRVYENSYSVSPLFPISPICCFHSIARRNGDLRIAKNDKLSWRGEIPDLKKLSKLRICNREVAFMCCEKLLKFEESRILRSKYLSG